MKTILIVTCLFALCACASPERHSASNRIEPTTGAEQSARVQRHEAHPARVGTAERVAPESIATPTDAKARDADSHGVTMAQSEHQSDLEITRRIREAVVKDDSLSLTAKNAKIVSRDGQVTLRGTVKSTSERTAIADHAGGIAGATHVDNELEVAP